MPSGKEGAACYQDPVGLPCSAGVCLMTGVVAVSLGVMGLSAAALVLCMFLWMVLLHNKEVKIHTQSFLNCGSL